MAKFILLYCENCDEAYEHDPDDGYDYSCPVCGEEMGEME